MSPAAKESAYVTYEWSFALGAGIPVIPVIYRSTELHQRLETLQHIDFVRARPWEQLIRDLKSYAQTYSVQLRTTARAVRDAVIQIEGNPYFGKNLVFRDVVTKSLSDTSDKLTRLGVGSRHSLPAAEYARYLVSVQRSLRAQVTALAIVDQQEQFWQQQAGREITETAHPNSRRVFVFRTPDNFDENFEALLKYASRYTVFALSYDTLVRKFGGYAKDFSIIAAATSKVMAEYEDDDRLLKTIRFSADPDEVASHEDVLVGIIRAAIPITNRYKYDDLDGLRRRVFGEFQSPKDFSLAEANFREMSRYIDIDAYDEHEERHAYYKEMMQRMVDICTERRGPKPKSCRILELGAGTGIFTKRLATLPGISECVAVELDFECFMRLQYKLLPAYPMVHPICGNSLSHDFPGRFPYIFSSFADHHISLDHKSHYFDMIKRKLAPRGCFIVGDEFLPAHDPDNLDAWRSALQTYHGHIIQTAEQEAARERAQAVNEAEAANGTDAALASHEQRAESYLKLVELERDALESGLARHGDFKVSCEQYEADLIANHLAFTKEKIGPLDRDDVGGVYVYVVWQPREGEAPGLVR
jgi:SAM-dependent methyltransferase